MSGGTPKPAEPFQKFDPAPAVENPLILNGLYFLDLGIQMGK